MAKTKATDKGTEASPLGAAGGAAAGAAAGAFLGPLGAAVGAIIGGVAGSGAKVKVGSMKDELTVVKEKLIPEKKAKSTTKVAAAGKTSAQSTKKGTKKPTGKK